MNFKYKKNTIKLTTFFLRIVFYKVNILISVFLTKSLFLNSRERKKDRNVIVFIIFKLPNKLKLLFQENSKLSKSNIYDQIIFLTFNVIKLLYC